MKWNKKIGNEQNISPKNIILKNYNEKIEFFLKNNWKPKFWKIITMIKINKSKGS